MTIDQFLACLHDGKYPGDYQIDFSHIMTPAFKIADLTEKDRELLYPEGDIPKDDDDYEIVTDVHVCGIAVNDAEKMIRFIIEPSDAALLEQHISKTNFLKLLDLNGS